MPPGAVVDSRGPSVSVVLTCRDEKDNIEPLVQAIPRLACEQEILFVEGHSIDGTREEIERCIRDYPGHNIRLIGQPGTGQGDAILAGFSHAQGEIVILLEADMTSPPSDVRGVYESIRDGRAAFVEGSRFTKPIPPGAMPFLNRVGNRLFAAWFSLLLGQRFTDVLCGIKGIRKSDFKLLAKGWGQWGTVDPFGDFELLLGAAKLGLVITEVPVSYDPRSYGASKTRPFRHGGILLRIMLFATFRIRWRRI